MTFSEYYQNLQIEYLIAKLRSLTYLKPKDNLFFKKVLKVKKNKIVKLAISNNCSSIFSSNTYKEVLLIKILGTKGIPNYHYKNGFEEEFSNKDIINYFSKNASVVYLNKDKLTDIGRVFQVNLDSKIVSIEIDEEIIITRPISKVRRNDLSFNSF